MQEGLPLTVARGHTGGSDSRFVAEDSEDGRQHSLTIVAIQPSDAGEYGVIINGVYTIVTKIVVTGRLRADTALELTLFGR